MQVDVTPADASRFWAKVRKTDGCWLWTAGRNRSGYGNFWLSNRTVSAHKVAWLLIRGDIPDNINVCHECDVRVCVRPAHLFLGTHLDNMADRNRKGRTAAGARNGWATHPGRDISGERNPRAVLTAEAVTEIRRRYASGGTSLRALGLAYSVSKRQVLRIVQGHGWRGDEAH